MNRIRTERPTAITAGARYLLATAAGMIAVVIGAPTELGAMADERGAVLGSALMVAGFMLPFTGDPNASISTLLYGPMFLQEMVLAVWMIGRGFRPTTPIPATIEERTAWPLTTTS